MTDVTTVEPGISVSQPENRPANTEAVTNYTDGYSYEVPRPFLTLEQAAQVLGKSLRSIERSLLGRWGNKLPEGWAARKIKTGAGEEWRILPPPGFRVKFAPSTEYDTTVTEPDGPYDQIKAPSANQLTAPTSGTRRPWRPDRHTLDQHTIVIDRSEEVEHLLRELVSTKSALAEERRTHMEDLRMITQLQSSMRLLEVNSTEQARAKMELERAKQDLSELKQRYELIVRLPWWRRLFTTQL